MEYRVNLVGASPDAAALAEALSADDPAAIGELDPISRIWRVNTVLASKDIISLLERAGCPTAPAQVALLPSVCCGGCSG